MIYFLDGVENKGTTPRSLLLAMAIAEMKRSPDSKKN
jgi:hypothetical protein